ncbi:phosphoribosylformylglycinamidine cyclo-ligase [Candidatus Roizmanbacteria bacterium]|nr:phosphoribosylformylglycinamidine cyclo-ligase [Candidatus Roizmanbacteria bacterium]
MSTTNKLTYKESGVNYEAIDYLKRIAQQAGEKTVNNLPKNYQEVSASRGESAHVIDAGDFYFASVTEGLGTKSLVADEMYPLTGKTYYDSLAYDTVAMIVNDLITVGAKPLTLMAYWAAGSSDWFKDKKRAEDLVDGWTKASQDSDVVWGGGETPVLSEIINKEAIDLAGACFGIISPKKNLCLGEKLQTGDRIILFESSGIHANGLTLARKIAESLPEGYLTKIDGEKTYGEALLTSTIIYAKLVEDLLKNNIDIHYMVNITGHGWRKLMRHWKSLTYRITNLPPVPKILQFIIGQGKIDNKEAYGNLNMGAGFAIFVPANEVSQVLNMARKLGINAYNAGVVESGEKKIIIEPKNITFGKQSLQVRT